MLASWSMNEHGPKYLSSYLPIDSLHFVGDFLASVCHLAGIDP